MDAGILRYDAGQPGVRSVQKVAKITISLPMELLTAVEQAQAAQGATRDETVAYLLEIALRREQEQAEIERYVRGYLEHPETEDELALTDPPAREAATWDPWP